MPEIKTLDRLQSHESLLAKASKDSPHESWALWDFAGGRHKFEQQFIHYLSIYAENIYCVFPRGRACSKWGISQWKKTTKFLSLCKLNLSQGKQRVKKYAICQGLIKDMEENNTRSRRWRETSKRDGGADSEVRGKSRWNGVPLGGSILRKEWHLFQRLLRGGVSGGLRTGHCACQCRGHWWLWSEFFHGRI